MKIEVCIKKLLIEYEIFMPYIVTHQSNLGVIEYELDNY